MLAQKYNFITVEGNTGAGKTSLARMLADQYGGKLILEEFVDNPFLPHFYNNPERYAFHTEVYFMLDRHQQLSNVIQLQQLQQGFNISDYLFNKSLLYAEVNLPTDEFKLFERMFKAIYPKLPQPEFIIYVHATVPRLIRNIQKRGRDFEQSVRAAYLQEVEDIYFRYFDQNPQLRILVIHADDIDFVEEPQHYEQIVHWVNQDYTPGIHHVRLKE